MNIFLILSTLVILYFITLFCEIFTNAIEHLGLCFKIQDGALGSIFAAIGTAFPETVLPLIAVFGAYLSGTDYDLGKEIGKGAILGSPFMLSTLAFFLVAAWVILLSLKNKRQSDLTIDGKLLRRDLKFFLFAYTFGIISAFIPASYSLVQNIIAVFLLFFYLFYAVRTVNKSCNDQICADNKCEELFLIKIFRYEEKYRKLLIIIQFLLSALLLMIAAHCFVENIKQISSIFHFPAMIISLFLAPVATELPETVNGLVWSSKNKDTLAILNITGAMVFQACIPMCIGILFTDWIFGIKEIFNVICVYVSVFILYFSSLRKQSRVSAKPLLLSFLPYAAYAVFVMVKAN